MLSIRTGSGVGSMSEDAFGLLPAKVDESKPAWHIPPGFTIPHDRRALNESNAWALLSHPSSSIRTQARELLDGIEAPQKPYKPDEHEMAMWYMQQDEDGRERYEKHMDRFDSAEDYFKRQQKG